MKTSLVSFVLAGLCLAATVPHVPNDVFYATTQCEAFPTEDNATKIALIGAGTIRAKNGNNFTIQSDDGNSYQAQVVSSYLIGDYVFHSDPVGGWVEILGHAD